MRASLDATDGVSDEVDFVPQVLDPGLRLSTLRDKYLDLAGKYTNVVRSLERNVAHQAIVFRLGVWALNVTANALAVVRDDQITMQNAHWLQLDGSPGGGWCVAEGDSSTVYLDLNQLARAEARKLPDEALALTVRRFRQVHGKMVIEVRLERPSTDPRVVLVIARDVTDQVEARRELSKMREAVLQNEHLAVVGELASSVAHDLGNTLRGISARVSVLARDETLASKEAAVLDGLRESVEIATASVRNLQDVARLGRLDPGPVALGDVIRRAVEIVQLRHPREAPPIEVKVSMGELPPVLGTVSELSHLFITIFFNARDAMPKGGRITVTARRGRGRARIVVSDTGTGFSEEALEHLFHPFFTTKGTAGTGLGLWLAQSTMRRFGGSIAARNRRGGGAEIELVFQFVADAPITPDREQERPRERRVPSS